jgi:hypothetical protein
MIRFKLLLLTVVFLILSCDRGNYIDSGFREETKEEIVQITPEKPVRVELRKTTKGYTWVLRGEDVKKVIETDRALRRYMEETRTKKE